jgi:pantothenate kinase type III
MMLLTLDFGNSNPNFAFFKNEEIVQQGKISELESYLSQNHLSFGDIEAVASIVGNSDQVLELEKQGLHITKIRDYWKGEMFAGVKIHYEHTLGDDRLITNWFVAKTQVKPVLVIDAGTFTTIDVVSPKQFRGGFILPGVALLLENFKSGEKLPKLNLENLKKTKTSATHLPKSTEEAMYSSVILTHQFIENIINTHQITDIFLTGGKSSELKSILECITPHIILQTAPHLIHTSLRYWYIKNIKGL